jgi:CxxC-x17-CxxC domain-containing protein
MEFTDRTLTCMDCGGEFVFTAGEQAFFHERQFKNLPKRCRACKEKRPSGRAEGHSSSPKQEIVATCAGCGKETTLPFRPTQGRPVFCRDCFKQKRGAGSSR